MRNIYTFSTEMPDGFLWGSGYAGHQVEGENYNSNKWKIENDENYAEKSGMACNSYKMFETDINLVEQLGHQAFRTSIEWSRIEPEEGVFDVEATKHYVRFFSGLKEKGIKVFVTIIHFTYPVWFMEKGHFTKYENIKFFERFLEYIVPEISQYVDYWNVFNEFNLEKAPIYKINCIKYHARGYHIIKKYSSAPISSAHAFVMYMPYRPNDTMDIAMTKYFDAKDNEFFFHAIRTGEIIQPMCESELVNEVKGTADFWSINIYTRTMIDSRKSNCIGERYKHKLMKMIDIDFYLEEFYPECVIANLTRLTDKPVYITENGCSCNDDKYRIKYLIQYLSAIKEAIDMGVDVKGYLYWSLMDNYEWFSYEPKFGLCNVDFNSFERTPKPSALFYREIIKNNGVSKDIIDKYLKANDINID